MNLITNLLIAPLLIIYSGLFGALLEHGLSPGSAIVAMSVCINTVLVPVYAEMERSAQAGGWRREAMNEEIARITKAFKRRERYFYVRTIHRHFGYHPSPALFASGTVAIQAVSFIAMHRFLSLTPTLSGSTWLGLALDRPDGLVFGANVMPFVMTALNIGSTVLYTRERTGRITAFVTAALFLVLLYGSPAGMVLYWSCNNLFSLVRNVLKQRWSRATLERLQAIFSRKTTTR